MLRVRSHKKGRPGGAAGEPVTAAESGDFTPANFHFVTQTINGLLTMDCPPGTELANQFARGRDIAAPAAFPVWRLGRRLGPEVVHGLY